MTSIADIDTLLGSADQSAQAIDKVCALVKDEHLRSTLYQLTEKLLQEIFDARQALEAKAGKLAAETPKPGDTLAQSKPADPKLWRLAVDLEDDVHTVVSRFETLNVLLIHTIEKSEKRDLVLEVLNEGEFHAGRVKDAWERLWAMAHPEGERP